MNGTIHGQELNNDLDNLVRKLPFLTILSRFMITKKKLSVEDLNFPLCLFRLIVL